MAYCGKFSPVTPGETKSFSLNLAAQLAAAAPLPADSIASITSVTILDPSGTDPNPSGLLISSPAITATTWISQKIGGAFVPGVVYIIVMSCLTVNGQTLTNWAHLPCTGIV